MAPNAALYAGFLLQCSVGVLAALHAEPPDGTVDSAAGGSTIYNMTPSLEAAGVMVAAWPPALCA
eukprot:CAMPEP_0171271582 /NCGR_PEP_ID=MMETSP0790-20130122/61306_1 /TAXON_ID=2925 /ORGANISM="Alexandrium catenella, Strain OF101" /LENGTH=64 /DNA_ID=CAMNT_0011740469 /DNA_START=12 /DNA_END=202 /DNA_ORIENTATION=-